MGHKVRKRVDTVEGYFSNAVPWQQLLVQKLRALVARHIPEAKLVMKWGAPVYVLGKPFAYIGCFSKSVNLGFIHGADLEDPEGLLRGTGKEGRHIPIAEFGDWDESNLLALLEQAAENAK